PECGPAEEVALARVLASRKWGRFGEGEIERFERRFAEMHGVRFALAVTSGTVALRVALMAIGIEAGDEVIVPPYTFLATATAVVECNAVPVFVDIEPESYNLDPALVEAAITPRTRAIIPVHFAGLPADMDAINAIAARENERRGCAGGPLPDGRGSDRTLPYGRVSYRPLPDSRGSDRSIAVIEDAAHAHGGRYKGRPVGGLGNLACFSFQSSKNLTSGEGGAVLTNDERLYEAARTFHNCGRRPEGAWYAHYAISGNYRITELQAALLNAQLDRFPEQAARRTANGDELARRIAGIPGLTPQRSAHERSGQAGERQRSGQAGEQQRSGQAGDRNTYHLFLFRYDPAVYGVPKDVYIRALRAEGVPLDGGYPAPLHHQPLFRDLLFGPYTAYRQTRPDLDYRSVRCPVAERACADEALWIYQSALLGPPEDVADIAAALEKVYANRAGLKQVAGPKPGAERPA
ncbi:MAG: DegT/DnrJ/EryC1/StrS family aminotransferase, partial [Planctomycetota bacterium]